MPTVYTSAQELRNIPAELHAPFLKKVDNVAAYLRISPDWLMAVFRHESGLWPQALGPVIGSNGVIFSFAVGLNQFISTTAKGLKNPTTIQDLYMMNALQQLDYVSDYFEPFRGRIRNFTDVMLINFFPAALPHSGNDNYVFETAQLSRSLIAKNNPAFDKNKDGKVTMAEFKTHLRGYYGKIVDSGNPNINSTSDRAPRTPYTKPGTYPNLFDIYRKRFPGDKRVPPKAGPIAATSDASDNSDASDWEKKNLT